MLNTIIQCIGLATTQWNTCVKKILQQIPFQCLADCNIGIWLESNFWAFKFAVIASMISSLDWCKNHNEQAVWTKSNQWSAQLYFGLHLYEIYFTLGKDT